MFTKYRKEVPRRKSTKAVCSAQTQRIVFGELQSGEFASFLNYHLTQKLYSRVRQRKSTKAVCRAQTQRSWV